MELKLKEMILYIVLWAALVAGYLIVSRMGAPGGAAELQHTSR
jgi:hypothetical protein